MTFCSEVLADSLVTVTMTVGLGPRTLSISDSCLVELSKLSCMYLCSLRAPLLSVFIKWHLPLHVAGSADYDSSFSFVLQTRVVLGWWHDQAIGGIMSLRSFRFRMVRLSCVVGRKASQVVMNLLSSESFDLGEARKGTVLTLGWSFSQAFSIG